MDKGAEYRALIRSILTHYATLVARQTEPGIEPLLAFDDEHGQYLWLHTGWSAGRRVYGVTVHARLCNNQIWIEQDWTEDGIATDLVQAGVPHEDIVLAFHEPTDRPTAGVAVA